MPDTFLSVPVLRCSTAADMMWCASMCLYIIYLTLCTLCVTHWLCCAWQHFLGQQHQAAGCRTTDTITSAARAANAALRKACSHVS